MEMPAKKGKVMNPQINWTKAETEEFLQTVVHLKDKFEVTKTQQEVEVQLERVEELRKRLRTRTELTEEQSDKLETELEDIKKGILDNEAKLKSYYGENRKSFMFAVMLMFLSFLFYGVYLMIYGHGK